MNRSLVHAFVATVLVITVAGCRQTNAPEGTVEIAVTNSYLGSAVRDLCGDDTGILSLAPPGMCPGHFDISPGQVRQLRRCRLLLLFDFQQQIRQSLARLEVNGLGVHLVQTPAGLCVPDTYIETCRRVCEILSRAYPEQAAQFQERLSAIRKRLETLTTELRAAVAECDAASAKVLVSNHQSRFAEWLGLEPVGAFIGGDIETAANIDHCLRRAGGRQVRFVIANRQEGTALAEALAGRLQARAVVFSNFPPQVAGGPAFDTLVRDNLQALLTAAKP